MPLKSAISLAIAIFAITVLSQLPAAVLPWLLPATLRCDAPSGTLWEGECTELRGGEWELADVHWTLHPAALLRAQLSADLVSADPRAAGRTRATLHLNGLLELERLDARVPLQGGWSLLPSGWSGILELHVERASLRSGQLSALQGRVILRQLRSEQSPEDFGSYELDVPAPAAAASGPSTPIVGQLRDIDGPLSVQGELRLSSQGAYELSGTLAPRGGASPELRQALQLLGPPDAQGRYPLSLAGTV
ncbi:MAG: type II secretion system protein N [Steroidobacteraceae bacterium]|jgi:general secretion pathway protein N